MKLEVVYTGVGYKLEVGYSGVGYRTRSRIYRSRI